MTIPTTLAGKTIQELIDLAAMEGRNIAYYQGQASHADEVMDAWISKRGKFYEEISVSQRQFDELVAEIQRRRKEG